jgi:hypothetical protein
LISKRVKVKKIVMIGTDDNERGVGLGSGRAFCSCRARMGDCSHTPQAVSLKLNQYARPSNFTQANNRVLDPLIKFMSSIFSPLIPSIPSVRLTAGPDKKPPKGNREPSFVVVFHD